MADWQQWMPVEHFLYCTVLLYLHHSDGEFWLLKSMQTMVGSGISAGIAAGGCSAELEDKLF